MARPQPADLTHREFVVAQVPRAAARRRPRVLRSFPVWIRFSSAIPYRRFSSTVLPTPRNPKQHRICPLPAASRVAGPYRSWSPQSADLCRRVRAVAVRRRRVRTDWFLTVHECQFIESLLSLSKNLNKLSKPNISRRVHLFFPKMQVFTSLRRQAAGSIVLGEAVENALMYESGAWRHRPMAS